MKKVILIGLLFAMVVSLTACDLKDAAPDELHEMLDDVVGWVGSGQRSTDDELIGKREAGEDSFSGAYQAKPEKVTGRDVVFGGSSILTRTVKVEGTIHTEEGSAAIRVRMNDEVINLTPDSTGIVETQLHFISGGNYVMVDYKEFTGTVEMTCTVLEDAQTLE